MPAVVVDAEIMARQCRQEAEAHVAASQRLLGGAQLMVGVDPRVVQAKAQDAMYEQGAASAYATIATALEKLVEQGAVV